MSLEKELEGVTAPEIESPVDLTDDGEDDGVLAPTPDGGKVPDVKSDDRPVQNVRGELLRKQSESEQRILAQLTQLANTVASLANKPTSVASGEKTLDEMSVDELKALKAKVVGNPDIPAEKKAEFEEYYTDRKVADRVNSTLNKFQESEKVGSERKRANQLAVDRYPQLLDRTSEMRLEVTKRLDAMDQNYHKYNPRIVLNIAEDVAGDLGVAPRTVKGARGGSAPSSVNRSQKPTTSKAVEGTMTEAEYNKIAEKLRHAAPKGGFKKDRVLQRSAEYAEFNKGTE